MNSFTHNKFKELAQVNKPYCISIFIPAHRAGKEVNEKIDQLNLKNMVQEVEKELESRKLGNRQIAELLQPIINLIEDSGFWNNQSDGLAIFRNKDIFVYYTVPVLFDEFLYISDHFYLKPMIEYLNDSGKYYLLSLSLSGAKLYEGFPHQIDELLVDDLLPGKLQDVVGYDYVEKNLQFRSGQEGTGKSMYHGHGKGKEEDKTEILKFFRAINDGVMKVIKNRKRPLVIAAVDYLLPLYKEVNEYPHLVDEFIQGNPEQEDPVLLHEKVRRILAPYFDNEKNVLIASFEKALSKNLASYKEEYIIPASYNQKVDTLFVRNREVMWGLYDKESNKILPREQQSEFKTCLLNFAAVNTFLNNGNVFLLEQDEMPEPKSKLNAIYRF